MANNQPMKKGDVVQLKSGGPRMTVSQVAKDALGEDTAWCDWFKGEDKQSDTFAPEQLKVVSG